jgi:hypothetical protein
MAKQCAVPAASAEATLLPLCSALSAARSSDQASMYRVACSCEVGVPISAHRMNPSPMISSSGMSEVSTLPKKLKPAWTESSASAFRRDLDALPFVLSEARLPSSGGLPMRDSQVVLSAACLDGRLHG